MVNLRLGTARHQFWYISQWICSSLQYFPICPIYCQYFPRVFPWKKTGWRIHPEVKVAGTAEAVRKAPAWQDLCYNFRRLMTYQYAIYSTHIYTYSIYIYYIHSMNKYKYIYIYIFVHVYICIYIYTYILWNILYIVCTVYSIYIYICID